MDEVNNKNKTIENKQKKEKMLFEASFNLFMENGIHSTTIQDIVDKAGLAKGTFYLYFKDKYDIQNKLIVKKSKQLFKEAIECLDKSSIIAFDEGLIFIINYIIDELSKNPLLLKFISKNLSWGIYSEKVTQIVDDKDIGIYDTFVKKMRETNTKIVNPEVVLFMIIELVSSTCFTSIINKNPLPINEYKPYLYNTIKLILKDAKQ